MPFYLKVDELEDESSFLQYGQFEEESFFQMVAAEVRPSKEREDLLINPNGLYRFGSVTIVPHPSTTILSRQTYSLLEWLGDVGGLNDSLYIIA